MFAKIDVNGPTAAPLYQFLRSAQPNPDGSTEITWNFAKFLVDKTGEVVARLDPKVTPEAVAADLARLL